MSARGIKALCRHFVEEFSKGKLAAMAGLDETNATNIVYHSCTGEDVRGLKDARNSPAISSALFQTFT